MRRAMLVAAILSCLAQEATARWVFSDGNSLYEDWCQYFGTPEELYLVEKAYCLAYVSGVVDTQDDYDGRFCLPAGVIKKQFTEIVVAYLRNHPENRHQAAASLVEAALAKKFPCN